MQLLAQEEYGLRCLLQVAQHRGEEPLSIQTVAEREGLSPEYAAKLMRALRKAGYDPKDYDRGPVQSDRPDRK